MTRSKRKQQESDRVNFTPLGARILIRRATAEELTEGGLLIPPTAREPPTRGRVLAVGRKVRDVKVGDDVLFRKYDEQDIKIPGHADEGLFLLHENHVQAVVENVESAEAAP